MKRLLAKKRVPCRLLVVGRKLILTRKSVELDVFEVDLEPDPSFPPRLPFGRHDFLRRSRVW